VAGIPLSPQFTVSPDRRDRSARWRPVVRRAPLYLGRWVRRAPRHPAVIRPGAVLEANPIAEFDAAPLAENFEGVAARRDAAGRTMIYMVSDDNFNFLQRTLLVMFELVD
jgi:hypothetical protein